MFILERVEVFQSPPQYQELQYYESAVKGKAWLPILRGVDHQLEDMSVSGSHQSWAPRTRENICDTRNALRRQMRPKAEWAIDSEAMRARGIIVLVKSN